MKYVILLLLGCFYSTLFSQNSWIEQLKDCETSIKTDIQNTQGYLFNYKLTEKYISVKKEYKYLNYWLLSKCLLEEIEIKITKDISHNYPLEISNNSDKYVRQYFPFINKKGEQIIIVTMSLLSKKEYERIEKRISSTYRGLYGKTKQYFVIKYNYSRNKFGFSSHD